MTSSPAGLWTDGKSAVLGIVSLRYYTPRDGRKQVLLGIASSVTLLLYTWVLANLL